MSAFKILLKCIPSSIIHPRTPILVGNPGNSESPVPWWGSITVLVVGIISWCLSDIHSITGLSEAARAMVYLPLGNLFGLTLKVKSKS